MEAIANWFGDLIKFGVVGIVWIIIIAVLIECYDSHKKSSRR